MSRTSRLSAGVVLAGLLALAGCGGGPDTAGTVASGAPTANKVTLRLGHFPNVTHATAIVGLEKGIFRRKLGSQVTLEQKTFNAGPEAVTALLSGALDATFIGPNPAINAYAQSQGKAIRIIAGATSGGAFFVTKPDIDSAADLKGTKVASPQRGNTQDVALRAWLGSKGLKTTLEGGGDVSVVPQENAQTLETFKSGQIAGAWVPEPWATRLQKEGGGKVLVDERDLWPNKRYVTTHLIVRTEYLEQNPDVVRRLLEGVIEADDYVGEYEDDSRTTVNKAIEKITDKALPADVIDAAWKNLTFTVDPIASSLRHSAEQAQSLELLDKVNLDGIYDLTLLNELLKKDGKPEVSDR